MNFSKILSLAASFGLMASISAFALPKATEIYPKMGLGYNIGNTMEVPENPTNWGNPLPTESYIKAIKAAGFNSIRIPCAWYSHSNALEKDVAANKGVKDNVEGNAHYTFAGKDNSFTNPTIDNAWLAQVKSVIDLAIKEGLYVVLNSHWDYGWLEDRVYDGNLTPREGNVTIANTAATTEARQKAFWTQIANYFKNYDEHLLFAGANEPGVNDPWTSNGQVQFDKPRQKILEKYHNAFISAVRATGGNNETRTLIVQVPRTEMDNAAILDKYWPIDPSGRGYMMAEVHYYPWQYSLLENDSKDGTALHYYVGYENPNDATHSMKEGDLGSPTNMAAAFKTLAGIFSEQNIPVIIGEFGAIKRNDAANKDLHLQGRAAFYGNVIKNAKANGFIPFVWDTGAENNHNMTFIRRQNGATNEIYDNASLTSMKAAYTATMAYQFKDWNDIPDKVIESDDGNALFITYTSTTAAKQEEAMIRLNFNPAKDLSQYVGIQVRMKGNIKSNGPLTGQQRSCATLAVFMFAPDWAQGELLTDPTKLDDEEYQTFTLKFSDFSQPVSDLTKVSTLGIALFATQPSGQIAINNIKLLKADGTTDMLDDFDELPSQIVGIAKGVIAPVETPLNGANAPTNNSSSSAAPTNQSSNSTAIAANSKDITTFRVNVMHGSVQAIFNAFQSGKATIALMNSLGQVMAQEITNVKEGANTIQLKTSYRGISFITIKQGSQIYSQKIILK